MPDLGKLELDSQAEEILSTKTQPQTDIVDLPYYLLRLGKFLQALKKLYTGIPDLVVFELQRIPCSIRDGISRLSA